MATKAQLEANRKNAQKSSGPVTDTGKAAIRQNALRHGLCACVPLMSDETVEQVEELLTTLREEHEPVGATEEILVFKMAEAFWFAKRASYMIAEQMDAADRGCDNERKLGLMLRYHTTSDRAYYKALSELRKLQKERQLQEIGFVSQTAPLEVEPPADPPANKPQTPPQPPAGTSTPTPTVANSRDQPPVVAFPDPAGLVRAA